MNEFEAEERYVPVDDVRVRCLIGGPEDGRPVVLLHGGGMDAATLSWKETFPALTDDYRVYAFDWPGFGESDPVPDDVDVSVDYYVDVLGELLRELDLVHATLVGISMGGGVALGYTLDHPARVSTLVLVDSYGLDSQVPGGKLGAAYVKAPKLLEATWWAIKRSRRLTRASVKSVVNPENLTEELVDDAYREAQRPNAFDAFTRFQRSEVGWSRLRTDYSDRADELPVPTLFVHGQKDELVSPEFSKRAADTAPVAELFTIPACGHWVPRECTDAFITRLRLWLER